MVRKKKYPETLIETLQEIFQFTETELTFNRRNILSDSQRKRMLAKHENDRQLARFVLLFLGGIGFLGSGAAALNEGIPLLEMWTALAITLIFFGAVVWLVLYYSRAKLERTVETAEVKQVSGRLFFTSRRNEGKTSTHYMIVGNKEFPLMGNGLNSSRVYTSYELNQLITPGQHMTVYYTEPWVYVLSLELHYPAES